MANARRHAVISTKSVVGCAPLEYSGCSIYIYILNTHIHIYIYIFLLSSLLLIEIWAATYTHSHTVICNCSTSNGRRSEQTAEQTAERTDVWQPFKALKCYFIGWAWGIFILIYWHAERADEVFGWQTIRLSVGRETMKRIEENSCLAVAMSNPTSFACSCLLNKVVRVCGGRF